MLGVTSLGGQTVCVSPGQTQGEFELQPQEAPSSVRLDLDFP